MAVDIQGTKYLQATEVAVAIGVTRQTLWRWRRDGSIPIGSRYRGRQIVFTPKEVDIIRQFADRIEPISNDELKTTVEGQL
jgi:hypothetical protein